MRAVVIVSLLCARVAFATSYAPPEKHDVRSVDKQFVLHVDPESKLQTIDGATPWSFPHAVGFESFYLANDGRSAAVVSWRFVHADHLDDAAVELWNAGGRFKVYSIRDLVARPPRVHGVGPIGPWWRDWLVAASVADGRLVVTTTGLFGYAIDMATGEIVDRRLSIDRVIVEIVGFAMLAFALVLALWARRATRRLEWPRERQRLVVAILAPLGALVWLWLELAGIPYVPNTVIDWMELALLVASLVMAPVSLVATARLPRGSRWIWIVANVAALIAMIGVRFVW